MTEVVVKQVLAVVGGDMRPVANMAICFVAVFGTAAVVQLYRYLKPRPKHRSSDFPEQPLYLVLWFNLAVFGETVLQRLAGRGR